MDNHLLLIEFNNSNSYHSSIVMAPFEALYGRICRSLVGWFEIVDPSFISPIIVISLDRVHVIRYKFKVVYSRQKSYADNRRINHEF